MNGLSQKTFQDLCLVPTVALGGFAVGCVAGALIGAPIVATGALLAVTAAANKSINIFINELALKFKWKPSSVVLIKTVTTAAIYGAAVAATVGLGILSSAGAVVFGAIIGIGFLHNCRLASQVRGEEASFRGPGYYTRKAAFILNA